MAFADPVYLIFLGLLLLLWPFVPARGRVVALLAASWGFYLGARPAGAPWLLVSTALDFAVGLGLGRSRDVRARRAWLGLSLLGNLALLGTFKYAGFVERTLGPWLGFDVDPTTGLSALVAPLGISFYTFQTLSYSVDVYRGRLQPCRDPLRYALYVSFFPQLVAGPIERARHLLPQLERLDDVRLGNLLAGGPRLAFGLAKKWLVADRLAAFVWPLYLEPAAHDAATLALVAIATLVVLYLDFSAYTDVALGSARLFGVELVENFRHPFLSTSVSEYARRWHVSLMDWMTDYVYLPLVGLRAGHLRFWGANLAVMALFGLWHGARWTFVLWGVAFGVAVSLHHSARLLGWSSGRAPRQAWRRVLAWGVTLLLVSQFSLLFFAPDVPFALDYLRAELQPGLPLERAGWERLATLLAVLSVLLAVHAAGARGWPGRAAERLGPWSRALFAVGLLAACVLWRTRDPLSYVYFAF